MAEKEKKSERKKSVGRVKTGVPGLDDILYGGIPKESLVVLSGDPGSGKTVFCVEYLYNGIKEHGEKGVFISLEEDKKEITKMASMFGWDLEDLIETKLLAIETIELYDFDKLKNTVEDLCQKIGAQRLVIDPGVIFRLYFERDLDARKRILTLGKMLKRIGVTSVITNEISLDKTISLFGLEEYVADGVILLYHTKLKDRFIRGIGILKMRGTRISEKLHPIRIDETGLTVLSNQELLEDIE